MNNSWVIFGFIFILLTSLSAAELEDAVGGLNDQIQDTTEGVEKTKEQLEDLKWEYLSEQWREFMLKNRFIAGVDSLFQKISFVFFIFMGMGYELSFTFWMVFILWIWFFFNLSKILRDFSTFSSTVSSVIALGVTIIAAQVKIFLAISNFIFKIIFYKSGMWPWLFAVLVFVGLLVIFSFIRLYSKAIAKYVKGKRKREAEELERVNRERLNNLIEGPVKKINKALGDKE